MKKIIFIVLLFLLTSCKQDDNFIEKNIFDKNLKVKLEFSETNSQENISSIIEWYKVDKNQTLTLNNQIYQLLDNLIIVKGVSENLNHINDLTIFDKIDVTDALDKNMNKIGIIVFDYRLMPIAPEMKNNLDL